VEGKQRLVNFWKQHNVVTSEQIINSFNKIPRETFLPDHFKDKAYHDHPLPTMREQSISQPTTIMMMMQALELEQGQKVFEVGSGVGYQAALIAEIIKPGIMVTTEVIPELVAKSRINIQNVGLTNVKVLESDGGAGFNEEAPYDRIIITAACPTFPQPLIDQLKEGGIIVGPVGDVNSQTMIKGTKIDGRLELDFLGEFRFVLMRGQHGFKDENNSN